MADNDDKRDDSGKRTLTLKSNAPMGARPGMGRSARTVVVEKRTRRVGPPGAPSSFTPAPVEWCTAPLPRMVARRVPRRLPAAVAPDRVPSCARPAPAAAPPAACRRPKTSLASVPSVRPPPARPTIMPAASPTTRAAPRKDARRRAVREGRRARPRGRSRREQRLCGRGCCRHGGHRAGSRRSGPWRRALRSRRAARRRSARAPRGSSPISTNLPPAPPSEADGRRARSAPPAAGAARPLVGAAELENARRARAAVPERPTPQSRR